MPFSTDRAEDRGGEFVQLLARHERRLEGYVLSMLPNWHDAEEVVQDTKLKLWQQFSDYDPTKDFGAWACTIAYYQILAIRHRSQAKHVLLGDEFLEKVAAKVAQVAAMSADRENAMSGCVQQLSEARRTLLRRCYAGGETIAQIASQLGRTADSVRQELLRVRRTLHRCIDAALRRGGDR
jgi:RNA polymerase sigma-70 factor, ECF subfamily